MKKSILLSLLLFVGCVGTDVVDDQIVNLTISVEEVELINGSTSTLLGNQLNFSVEGLNDKGSKYEPEVTWTSSDGDVAIIDELGRLQSVGAGSTTVIATSSGVESNEITVSVVADADGVALIELVAGATSIDEGETTTILARPVNVFGQAVSDVTVTWESADENIATVSPDGEVTGVGSGTTDIIASAEGVSSSIEILVGQAATRSGTFEGVRGYSAQGIATMEMDQNGVITLTFDSDFRISSGPGLYVYLSNNRQSISGGIELNRLQSTRGAQTYTIPSGVSLTDFNNVLIFCKPFGIPFGVAELETL